MLYGQNIDYIVLNKHSFTLPANSIEIKSGYLRVDDTLDLFNYKEKELGSLKDYGSIGDMQGYDLELRYGYSKKDSIFFNYQLWNIDYGDSVLKNNKIDIFNKYNLYSNQYSFFNSFTIDIGYTQNSSVPIEIKDEDVLNGLIKKISPTTTLALNNGSISYDNTVVTMYDRSGNLIKPSLGMEDLKDRSFYARVILGKKISAKSLLDLYMGFKQTKITTTVKFYPDNYSTFNDLLGKFDIPNLNRSESTISCGFLYTMKSHSYIYEFSYEYDKIFRDSDVSYVDSNNIFNIAVSKNITKHIKGYLSGKIMQQQFNTDIPYFYNQYTKAQFDKKYGFVSVGIIYKF